MASISDANDARSIVDPGGTLEAPATDAAAALTRASQEALPQERGDDVDVSLSTARSVSPQDSAGAEDTTALAAVETSSSGMRAVDVIPAPPPTSSPVPSPQPSLVGGATAPVVVETNSSGNNASPSHGLSSEGRYGHPQVNTLTDPALVKTGSSDSGVVDVHGTTSLRGASGARISGRPQESGASKRVTAAAGEAGSSDTDAGHATLTPLPVLSARSSTPTPGYAAVDNGVVPAAVDTSSVGPGAVDVDVRAPTLGGSSSPRPPPAHHSTSQASSGNQAASGPAIEVPPIPHGAAVCAATDQLQEVAELLKHAGNLLSRIGISNAQHVHVRESDCKSTTCSCACACAQIPHSPPSVSGVTGGARAVSTAAVTATPAPAAATSSTCGMLDNHAGDIQDSRSSGPPPKDPQGTQQMSSAAQQVPSSQQAPPGQLTGWAAVEKALKEFDQQEIGGYKEDIDSLLTFTGLYSAVLTAFVIVSYPLLQDPNQASASMSMSTPSAVSSPFQPPITAIRINILWFASLVISLATASFAILVKQWLRAYMAFATASPQGQLRVRHFRRNGLTAWRVFGIASTLPLLLQISLALFFAGLCIFTWDVHPTLGKTTLPLVAAWAFLFLVVTIAPSFTARCPYTTPALAGITHALRTRVYPPVVYIIVKYILHGIAIALYWVFDFITNLLYVTPFKQAWAFFEHAVEHTPQFQLKLVEESDMIKNPQLDLKILAFADALQADDHLLGTTIKSALEQSNANWVQHVEFAVQIIGNRVPLVDSEINPKHISDVYGTLSPMVQEVVCQIFRSHAVPKLAKMNTTVMDFPKNWKMTAWWAFCTFIHIPSPDAPFLPLCLDESQLARIGQQADIIKRRYLEQLSLAVTLYRTSGFMSAGIRSFRGMEEYAPLQLTFQWVLQISKEVKSTQKTLVRQCLIFDHAIIWQIFDIVYTNENDLHHLSNIIHSVVDLESSDFKSLKAIEILKLLLLAVRVIYGKISANQANSPIWSSNEAAQWKRTFILLAYRLWDFRPFSNLSPDELAALPQLARSGWGEIPDQTEDSSQEALPLPDSFYLMLWQAARKDLSQIPSQHSQLLRFAHMSSDEQIAIYRKGLDMARAYRDNPGNLYPPGFENDNGQGQEGRVTSAPAQGAQDSIPNDSRADAEELGVAGGLKQKLSTDTSDVSPSESRAPSEAEVTSTEAPNQYSQTNSGPAGGSQLEETPSPMHESTYMSEDKDLSQSEELDDSSRELTLAGDTTELAEGPPGPDDVAHIRTHQASAAGGVTPSVAEGQTTPRSLSTSSRIETILAEARDDSQVTADGTQADTTSNHTIPSHRDNAAVRGEVNLQCMVNIAAGNMHTIQGARDEGYAHADVEAGTGSEEQMTEAGPRPADWRL